MSKSPDKEPKVFELSQGEVCCWLERGSCIMLKSVTVSDDPVELNSEEARELANELLRMATENDGA